MQFPKIDNLENEFKKEEYAKYLILIPQLKEEKTQKFITIVLTLLMSILLGLFAINPTLSTIANLQRQIDDDKFVDQQLTLKISNLSILQTKYAAIRGDLSIVYDGVPKTQLSPLMLGQIQSIAKDSNVEIINLQTFPVVNSESKDINKKYSSFNFEVSASGNYKDMLSFIGKLVNFQRVVSINSISISSVKYNNTNSLQLDINGSAFFNQ